MIIIVVPQKKKSQQPLTDWLFSPLFAGLEWIGRQAMVAITRRLPVTNSK